MSEARDRGTPSATGDRQPEADKRRPVRVRLRLPLWRALARVALVLLAAPIVFSLVTGLTMIGRDVTAPSWMKRHVEMRAAEALDGGRLRFGTVSVTVGTDLRPRVRLTDTVLRDAAGTVIARVPQVEALLSPRGLLFRRAVLPQDIILTGAQITLRRKLDGAVAVSFDGAGSDFGQADSFADLLAGVDAVLERPALAALRQVRARGLIANFEDARAGRSWTLDGGQLALDLRGAGMSLRGEMALLSGRDYVTTLALAYDGPRPGQGARLEVAVSDAAAADIATQSPALSWLSVLDAPLSATLRLGVDTAGAVEALDATLDIGAGALRPDARATPVSFDAAQARLTYDPAAAAIRFDRIAVQSDWGSLRGQGQAYLREMRNGWPDALLGQFTLSDISLNPAALYPEPLKFSRASADFRLRLNPFTVQFGDLRLAMEDTDVSASGEVAATPDGWRIALDGAVDTIARDRLLTIWPQGLKSGTRAWFVDNLTGGTLFNIAAALRIAPGAPQVHSVGMEYRDATVRVMRALPPVRDAAGVANLTQDALTLVLDAGEMRAPQGGAVDVAGSVLQIPDIARVQPPAEITLRARSTITAALSLLDQPPFSFLSKAQLPVTLADGRALVEGTVRLPLRRRVPGEPLDFEVAATLRDIRSDTLVPDRLLAAASLGLTADTGGISIRGPVRLDNVPMEAHWRQAFGPQAQERGRSRVEAQVELSERFVDAFRIGLPAGAVSGAGTGDVIIDLERGSPPAFSLVSDLVGVALRLPSLGWSKAAGAQGRLEVAGRLGAVPVIENIELEAAGLSASGSIGLNATGGLDRARFARVRLGGWLDGSVDLVGRGTGRAPLVVINGGTLDLRRANLGGSGSGAQGGPLRVALDRLDVAEGIALTDFRGEFDGTGGFSGQFAARVNGGAPVQGTLVPRDGRAAVRIISDRAGGVLRAAGLVRNAYGGTLDLTLLPVGGAGTFDGVLSIVDLRVRDAPALASLLNAVSVVGLLQELGGQGLYFSQVDAEFRIAPDSITLMRSSAVGPALGISLDGIYTLASKTMDFQGVVSPVYLLNGVGAMLTRRGEGLFGFAFRLRGPVDDSRITVNPLSALAPGFLREMFRRPAPNVGP